MALLKDSLISPVLSMWLTGIEKLPGFVDPDDTFITILCYKLDF